MEQKQFDVVIVGAGVIGSAIAYYVAKSDLKVALIDKRTVAGEASQAGLGMLAPLGDTSSDLDDPLQQLCFAALRYYDNLDQQLQDETGINIELVDAPTLRPAFTENDVIELQTIVERQQQQLPGLQWVEGNTIRTTEPLLPDTILGALISPAERNVQVLPLTQAFARGAVLHGTSIFEGQPVQHLIRAGQRIIGVSTTLGNIYADAIVLASGAWMNEWLTHIVQPQPALFPVKGQEMALQGLAELPLRHTIFYHGLGTVVPKQNGSIYVGATSELAGFDKNVTVEGLTALVNVVTHLAPELKRASFERAWAGLRPASADHLPLLGASQTQPGLWIAGGHYRDGILLGPLTGHILAELIQGHAVPFNLDLKAFDPDRFGDWNTR